MGAWEIVTIVVAVLIVSGVVVVSVVRKKKGKSPCCSDCSSCPYHCGCNKTDKEP